MPRVKPKKKKSPPQNPGHRDIDLLVHVHYLANPANNPSTAASMEGAVVFLESIDPEGEGFIKVTDSNGRVRFEVETVSNEGTWLVHVVGSAGTTGSKKPYECSRQIVMEAGNTQYEVKFVLTPVA